MSDLVSVIIPCFNAAHWVGDAIESALNQTHREIEVIVIDDGSTDDSLSVIKSFIKPFGRRIKCQTTENRGACAARNRGISIAQGEYVQFLDADDLLHPQKIEKQLQVMRGVSDTLVFSFHNVVSLDPRTIPARQWNRRDCCEDPVVFMFRGDLQTAAPLHHRLTIEKVGGFREDLPCAQDREFHLRMAMNGVRFVQLPEVLFTIRRRSGSIGTSDPVRVDVARGHLALESCNELRDRGLLNDSRQLECAAMLMRCARKLYEPEPKLAEFFANSAKTIHPTGGIHQAYSRTARWVMLLLGRRRTERIASLKRRIWELSTKK